jgi:3-polyprenyl-4-hydroxybenzoate decarboxylase
MPDQSFRTMLANLEQQGELIRFDKEVDPLTNMAAVQWRAYNEMGKARAGKPVARLSPTAANGPSGSASKKTRC